MPLWDDCVVVAAAIGRANHAGDCKKKKSSGLPGEEGDPVSFVRTLQVNATALGQHYRLVKETLSKNELIDIGLLGLRCCLSFVEGKRAFDQIWTDSRRQAQPRCPAQLKRTKVSAVSTTATTADHQFDPMLSSGEKVNLSELMLLNVLIKHLTNSNVT